MRNPSGSVIGGSGSGWSPIPDAADSNRHAPVSLTSKPNERERELLLNNLMGAEHQMELDSRIENKVYTKNLLNPVVKIGRTW